MNAVRPSAAHPGPSAVATLPRSFYARDGRDVAPQLLGKVLVHGELAGRIVEVEAYAGGEDPASHAYRGQTERNRVMFGRAGVLYVYFTYGMHFCANAVCGDEGEATAVLLRALAPLRGLETMRARRPAARRDVDLCNGPAKLCAALGIDRPFNGADLVTGDHGITIGDDGFVPPTRPGRSTRVGIRVGIEHRWRWYLRADPHVSRARGAGERRADIGRPA